MLIDRVRGVKLDLAQVQAEHQMLKTLENYEIDNNIKTWYKLLYWLILNQSKKIPKLAHAKHKSLKNLKLEHCP